MKMDTNPEARSRREPDDEEHENHASETGQSSIMPSLEPDDQSSDADRLVEAPPVDVDERDPSRSHSEPPELIELPDHGDEEAENENRDKDADESAPESWYEDEAVEPATSRSAAAYAPPGDLGAKKYDDASDVLDPAPETSPRLNAEPASETGTDVGADADPGAASGAEPQRTEDESGLGAKLGALSGSLSRRGGVFDGAREFLDPKTHPVSTEPHRLTIAIGAILVLLSLLGNNGGLALIILGAIVPMLIISTLIKRDVFETEPTPMILAVGAAGGVVGLIVGWLSSWLTERNWIDRGNLNFGAGGFAGRFAESAGTAPAAVWFLSGLLLPAIAIAGVMAGPIALRRYARFRNEVMDGVILGGASAVGFAIGTSLIYWSPMVGDEGPQTSIGDWTVAIIGSAIVRPMILVLTVAMIGAGIWKYMLTSKTGALIVPAIGGIGGFLLFSLGSIIVSSAGIWPEFIWTVVVAIAVFILYRIVLKDAVVVDHATMQRGSDDTGEPTGAKSGGAARVVCPSCTKVTPAGAFCANCGASLADVEPETA